MGSASPNQSEFNAPGGEPIARQYRSVRSATLALCRSLAPDDFQIQGSDFTSPPKWHLAHTTWFFERFILRRLMPEYRSPLPCADEVFNSYYDSWGPQLPRGARSLLSRPTLDEILDYRRSVDSTMA